jgi:hypothetical protein
MSELDKTWDMAESIADEINAAGNLNWAAHMRGTVKLGKSLQRKNEQIQATNQQLVEQLERVNRELPDAHIYLGMGESEPLKDSFDFEPIAKAITNAKQREK